MRTLKGEYCQCKMVWNDKVRPEKRSDINKLINDPGNGNVVPVAEAKARLHYVESKWEVSQDNVSRNCVKKFDNERKDE